MLRHFVRAWVLLVLVAGVTLLLTVCSRNLSAQGLFGTISGIVSDSSGAVVPGATVRVTNVSTNVVVTLTTNSAGAYVATSLNPGRYNVEGEAKGFKTAIVNDIELEVGASPKIDLTLQIGLVAEHVLVTAENAPLLQTQQSDLGQTVNERRLEQLPTSGGTGRNVYSLLSLAPGVSQQTGCDGCGNYGNVRISGSRPRSDDYTLDGSTVTAPVFGGAAVSPSVDSIQEFRIEQNTMSAEYGKAGGAILIAVSKSGTNAFHGTAYEYNRNQKLDARNFFEDPTQRKNPFTYDEFGGSIGGPIVKNKLFFFTDYQGIRSHGSGAAATNLVPDSNFRSGDLSALCTSGFDSSGNCATASHQIHFPGTTTPVPFNKIPSAQISTISQNLLAIWPTSTTPGGIGVDTLTLATPGSTSLNRFDPRIDFNLSKSDHLFGMLHTQNGRFLGYNLIVGPAGRQTLRSSDYATTEGWTHIFSPALVNDFRFGYMHRIGDRTPYGAGATSPSGFGISGIPNCLSSVPDTSGGAKCGTPGVSITGYNGISNAGMLYEPASTLQFSDVVSKLLGRNGIKTGGEFRHYSIDNYQPNSVVGQFAFTGSQTGNGFADFLFGAMNTGNVQVQNTFVSSRAWSYSFFVQDDLKLTSRLTLNLGLRWQYDQSFHETHHGDAFFNPYTAQWEQFGVNAPDTTFDPWRKEFGPRVGFAWNVRHGFVVRGGYGIMYPGSVGHGRAGDGQPGPNLLASTTFPAGTNWSSLPTVTSPDPSAITAPLPVNGNVSFSSWAPRKQTPTYVQLWNFTLEKEIGNNTIAQVGYVGSHGTHLPINYAYNICQQSPESTALLGYSATTSPYCSPLAAQQAGIWNLVVTPGWWGLSSSIYHSLQAKVDHRFSHGFSLLANFTWSKLIDDSSSDWGGFWSLDVLGQDFYNRRAERSVSAGDIPARLTIAPIVELPFGSGKRWVNHGLGSQVLGGWRMSAIYTVSAGSPFGITDNSYGYCNAAHVLSDRPNMIGDPLPSGFHQTPQHWFDVSAFDFSGTCPASNLVGYPGSDTTKAFGDAPRYFSKIRNPGVNNLDFSVQKDFKVPAGEQTRLTFSGDFFNLPNHPQFAEPNADPTVGNFGQISRTALNNRTIQLGLHLYF
jgi:Carboxypeptidase regulatory-like domain/TonB dependent receptor